MTRCWSCFLLIVGLLLSGCSSDPSAPVNQTCPIRQMDNFFDSLATAPMRARPTPIACGRPRHVGWR